MIENNIPKNLSLKEHFNKKDFSMFLGSTFYLLKNLKKEKFIDCVITSPPFKFPNTSYDENIEKHVDLFNLMIPFLRDGANIIYQTGSLTKSTVDLDTMITNKILNHCKDIHLNKKIILLTGDESFGNSYAKSMYGDMNFKGSYQTILWFSKGKSHFVNDKAFSMPDVIDMKRAFEKENDTDYMVNLPNKFYRTMIELFTREGDIIFEPFAGSHNVIDEALSAHRKIFTSEKSIFFVESAVANIYKAGHTNYFDDKDCLLFNGDLEC